MKKIFTLIAVVVLTLSLVACGGGNAGNEEASSTSADTGVKRDATYELSNDELTCIIEYDSSTNAEIQHETPEYAYIYCDTGAADMHLIQGSSSADAYVETFKEEKMAGNYSDYYVKDLVVEPLHSCEINGYTYNTYSFTYKDVYVSQGHEYDNSGIFGYVQLTDDTAILFENELYYEDWTKFVESAIYIKEVKTK